MGDYEQEKLKAEQWFCDWAIKRAESHSGTSERFINKYRFFPEWLANLRRGKMCTMRTFFRFLRIVGYRLVLNGQEVYSNADQAIVMLDICKSLPMKDRDFRQKYKALSGDSRFFSPLRSKDTLNFNNWFAIVTILKINYKLEKLS